MKHLFRIDPMAPMALRVAALAALVACGASGAGCSRSSAASDAGNTTSSSSSAGTPSWLARRDPNDPGSLPPPPHPNASAVNEQPKPNREPDWDLSSDDGARDYARRYAFFTRRYGDAFACAEFGASQPAGDKRRVEVKNGANCPSPGAVRDVFLIDLAGDHLSVDDKTKRDPLARWPDGSDPEGPAAPVREIFRMQDWKSPIQDAVRRQLLVPVRVQAYGRGTYPVVSLAGWHGVVQPGAPNETLLPLASALCTASENMPLGILSASDRTRILRVRCPSSTAWDRL